MFSIICDKDGNPLNREEMGEFEVGSLILLLRGYVKQMDYLHKKDKRALSYLSDSLIHRFQYYYAKKEGNKQ